MRIEIYPKFVVGQKVKAFQNLIVNGEIKKTPITLYGVVREIIIGRDILHGHFYYMYKLDTGDILHESMLSERL